MTLSERITSAVDAAVTAQPVDGGALLQHVSAREAAVAGRRRWQAAAAVALVAASVAGVAVGSSLLTEPVTRPAPGPGAGPAEAPAAVPPGQRAVSWHGLQVYVPDTWVLGDEFCGTPQSDTVLVPGITLSCLRPLVPGLTVVEFTPMPSPHTDVAAAATRPTEVSGRPARRGATVPADEPASTLVVLDVPDLDVTLTVRSPDAARAEGILDTARVVEADALGCPSRIPATTPPRPTVPGAAERVLPGEPVSVALCEYGDLRLERAGTMTPEQVRGFQALVDAAPVGTSPSRVGITVSAEICPELDRAPLVLLATYADGSTLQVFTRQNGCTGPDPDNGARQVRLDQDAVGSVYTALHESRRSPTGRP